MRLPAAFGASVLSAAVAIPLAAGSPPLPRATPESVGLDSARLQGATDLLKQYAADRKIAGAVAAVARRGKIAYLETVGVQDLQSGAPMTERSLFRIYSMTKPVTAVAIMMLHEQGRFALSDPVSKFLPEFKDVVVTLEPEVATRKPEREITIQDLLLHTSGLSHRTSPLYRNAKVRSRSSTLPQFIANMVRTPLMEDPGTRYRYSEATTVLGRLIEVSSGTPFDQFVHDRILKPLAMNDTSFWVAPDAVSRLATVYTPAPGGGLSPVEIEEVPFTVRPALMEGAVGLVSTVPDYLRFSQMLLNKGELDGARLLTAKTVEQITSNGLSPAILAARGGTMGWGLANVNVQTDPASPLRGEYGWDGTAGTIFWIDPAREMITVLMTQSSPANPDGLRGRFKTLVQGAVQ
jgi:CubicO group peptidase (beta-lactamase class C family)